MRAHPDTLSEPTDKPSGNECVDVETLVQTYDRGRCRDASVGHEMRSQRY